MKKNNIRIFLVGDYYSGTGPANVTKYYKENLPKGSFCQKFKAKLLRAVEMIFKIILSDVVCFSGYSKQNILGLKISKKFSKPTAYIMHGCVEYENHINHQDSEEMCQVERKTLEMVDRIFAVSPKFASWLKDFYPEEAKKVDYITNAIDDSLVKQSNNSNTEGHDKHIVFTVGGGMPRKKIKHICQAVDILRENFDRELRLLVIGDTGADSEIIDSYDFVDNKGLVDFETAKECYQKAGVFVQNSCFETFGLAFVEAVSLGCASLVSKEVGALCLVDNIRKEDIIEEYDNSYEIAEKIKGLIINSNNDYIRQNINWEQNSWKERSKILVEKLTMLVQ